MRLLLLAVSILLPPTAFCQTAEETAAFMTFGFEDNATLPSGKVSITGRDPLVYEMQTPNGPVTLAVSTENKCSYNFTITANGKPDQLLFDFTTFKGFRLMMDGASTLDFGDRCAVKIPGECRNNFTNMNPIPKDRMEKAVSYFRTEFCKGNAF